MSISRKTPTKQKPKPNIATKSFWHRYFTPNRDPEAALQWYAWRYCMAHYQQGSLGLKASSYGLQALIALITTIGTGLHFAKVYSDANPGAFVWLALAMLAMVWLYESAQGVCRIMVEAAEFADNAIMSVESQEEIPGFFDEFYPLMFYKK